MVAYMGKIYVVGDIHGMFNKFLRLKRKLPKLELCDKIIFLGDYIDRGPDGFKVLRYLYRWQQKNPNVICLKGNHEDMMLSFLDKFKIHDFQNLDSFYVGYDPWLLNSGEETVKSFIETKTPGLIEPIIQWLRGLPLYHKIGNLNFSHSGYNACYVDKYGGELKDEDYLWSRDVFLQCYSGEEKWYIGHTPTQSVKKHLPPEFAQYVSKKTNTPYSFNNITLMDTGSFITRKDFGKKYAPGKISCLEITTNTLYQA